ncbi:MauE/DoxX family redox-associated membrane protein [Actinomadura hibisca]|uniref:MauE/DoxX family redox-associated membrane protein n=1 Tax=Actinomadura hibisca TaxID=68565 RepID=UPI000830C51A|nr:MauE/DoxX family redox-associated membrane protein [Actinomadura hibisca]
MSGLLTGVAAVAVPLVLLASLAGQLRRPGSLAAALRAQRTVPDTLIVPVAAVVIVAEAVAGGAGAAGALLGETVLLRAGLIASAALLVAYAAYSGHVARTRRGVPCGCAGARTPMTVWVAVRAAALAVLAAAGTAGTLPSRAGELAVVAVAGATLAVLLWTLPQALTVKERSAAG